MFQKQNNSKKKYSTLLVHIFTVLFSLSIILSSCTHKENVKTTDNKQSTLISDSITTSDCAGEPFYSRFLLTPGNYVGFKLSTGPSGNFRIVLGTNSALPSKYNSIISLNIEGDMHKNIPYTVKTQEGRIFMIINFSVKDGEAGLNEWVFCHISIDKEKFDSFNEDEKKLIEESIGELGFRKL